MGRRDMTGTTRGGASGRNAQRDGAVSKQTTPLQTLHIVLEPRFVFDAAGVATFAEVVSDGAESTSFVSSPDHHTADTEALLTALAHVDSSAGDAMAPAAPPSAATEPVVPAPQEVRAADPSQNDGKREVVFIESNVADYQTLVDGVKPGIEVVLLDGNQDGLSHTNGA
jgi:Domain of unknown function (DUF4347)